MMTRPYRTLQMQFILVVFGIIVIGSIYNAVDDYLYLIGAVIFTVLALAGLYVFLDLNVLEPRWVAAEHSRKEQERLAERDRALAIGETHESRLADRYAEFVGNDIKAVARLRYVTGVKTVEWVDALKQLLETKLRPNVTVAEYDLALQLVMDARAGRSNILTKPIVSWRNGVVAERQRAEARGRGDHIKKQLSDGSIVSGIDFERWCKQALQHQGWRIEETPASGDQGVDLLGTYQGARVAIQCKHYSRTLGNGAVQEIIAGKLFYGASLGVVVSSGALYSPSAKKLADAAGVLLLSGNEIFEINNRIKSAS